MNKKIDYTLDLVKRAGQNIKELMATDLMIETKANHADFVTNVDKATEIFLVEGIMSQFENQDFLTEENTTPRHKSDDLWIIDPIDGTTNFIYQRKNFAISIAYYHKLKPVFGIVYDVMADKMYLGITGEGAFLNGVRLKENDAHRGIGQSVVYADLYALSMFPKGLLHLRDTLVAHRYLGAASLEICMVAENLSQAYISKNLKVWDVAAGVIILKEVGGTSFFGGHDDDIFFNSEDGVFISCQNDLIKDELKAMMDEDLLLEVIL